MSLMEAWGDAMLARFGAHSRAPKSVARSFRSSSFIIMQDEKSRNYSESLRVY